MKIAFIHSYDYYEPIGIMTLSSVLKSHGHQCELIDIKLERKFDKAIENFKPDIIAYSVTSNRWKYYQKLNQDLKTKHSFFAIFGGPHATFFPEFINENGIDAICRGEGEYAILELADALENNKDFTQIKNLWVKQGKLIIKNDIRDLIHDLDSIPFPDRELINKYKHYQKRSRIRIITSRGCPYNCSYCFNNQYKDLSATAGKFVRHRSPENVIEELEGLIKLYNPRNLEFHDDIFILDKKWLKEFTALKIKKNINIPYEVNVRVNLVTPEIVTLLKNSGCYSVQFGIETGNIEHRRQILNRDMSNETIINAAKLFKAKGILINAFNMVGIPKETINDTISTLKLNSEAGVTYAMNTIYQPFPGTLLSKIAVDMGLYSGDVGEFDKNYLYGKSIIKSVDRKRIERMHYLFAFGVKLPLIIPLLLFLTKLPLNPIYKLYYFIYRAYNVVFVFKRIKISEFFIIERI